MKKSLHPEPRHTGSAYKYEVKESVSIYFCTIARIESSTSKTMSKPFKSNIILGYIQKQVFNILIWYTEIHAKVIIDGK